MTETSFRREHTRPPTDIGRHITDWNQPAPARSKRRARFDRLPIRACVYTPHNSAEKPD